MTHRPFKTIALTHRSRHTTDADKSKAYALHAYSLPKASERAHELRLCGTSRRRATALAEIGRLEPRTADEACRQIGGGVLLSTLRARLASARRRGDYPWLTERLAVFDAQVQWLKQRWNLRSYTPNQGATLCEDPEKAVDWVFDSYQGALAPLQSRAELTEFARLVRDRAPRVVVEIGTARGGTLFVLCRMAADDAKIISIDLPAGAGGAGYPEWKLPILQSFAKKQQSLRFLRTDSHSESTLECVREALGGDQVDLLFIDGDHSYEGALEDFNRYSQLVRPGGLICMHDVIPNPSTEAIEVDRVWEHVSKDMQARIIRDPENLAKFGIGVLQT